MVKKLQFESVSQIEIFHYFLNFLSVTIGWESFNKMQKYEFATDSDLLLVDDNKS